MDTFNITGTYIWYYYICKREVWLLAHGIEANQQDDNMRLGKAIHEDSYSRSKKEVAFGDSKFDIVKNEEGQFVVGEIKKSSRYMESARMQLLFYLKELKESGIKARGLLLIPEEKKKETVILDNASEAELTIVIQNIRAIALQEKAPRPVKVKYCRNCAYAEFCWS